MSLTRKIFAGKLAEARKGSGYTQAGLAEKIGVDTRTVQNYEGQAAFPKPETLDLIAATLNKRTCWFLDDGGFTESPAETLDAAIRALGSLREKLSPPRQRMETRMI